MNQASRVFFVRRTCRPVKVACSGCKERMGGVSSELLHVSLPRGKRRIASPVVRYA